jgi:hypothetical protein
VREGLFEHAEGWLDVSKRRRVSVGVDDIIGVPSQLASQFFRGCRSLSHTALRRLLLGPAGRSLKNVGKEGAVCFGPQQGQPQKLAILVVSLGREIGSPLTLCLKPEFMVVKRRLCESIVICWLLRLGRPVVPLAQDGPPLSTLLLLAALLPLVPLAFD